MMSVRYTATWYDVMQAQQHHTHQSSTVRYSSPPPPPPSAGVSFLSLPYRPGRQRIGSQVREKDTHTPPHTGRAAGFLAVPARPAGLQLSVLSHTLTLSSHAVLQRQAAGTVYAGVIGSKWRSSVL